MVNSDFGPAFILGIALILSGVALYGMRSFRPELSRDHDIFFAAIALVSGLILMFQGWRLDPLLFLGQLSLAGSAAFFAFENIRLRGVTTEQAKRNTPVVDDERPVSARYEYNSDYESDYDGLPTRERRSSSKRIRASRNSRNAEFDEYRNAGQRRPPSRRLRVEADDDYRASYRPDSSSPRRLPRSRRSDDPYFDEAESWNEPARDDWDRRPMRDEKATWDVKVADAVVESSNSLDVEVSETTIDPGANGSTYRSSGKEPKSLSRYRRNRASSGRPSSYSNSSAQPVSESYADYQPVHPDDEFDS